MNINLSVPESTRNAINEIADLVDQWELPAVEQIQVELGDYRTLIPLEQVKGMFQKVTIYFVNEQYDYAYLKCKVDHSSKVEYSIRVKLSELDKREAEPKIGYSIPGQTEIKLVDSK